MRTNCEVCGTTPATLTTSRWHLGMIIYGRTRRSQKVLCPTHARQQLSGDLTKTLLLGWWGVFSLFINVGIVASQITALRAISAPTGASGTQRSDGR